MPLTADVGSTAADQTLLMERRRGQRVRQNRPIKIFEPTTSRYFGGQTEDVSATGLRIELPASVPLRPGKVLTIHVGLDATGHTLANRRQMMPARVIWIQPAIGRHGSRTMAGIELLASIAAHLDAA